MKIQNKEELDQYLNQNKTRLTNAKSKSEIIIILKEQNIVITNFIKGQFNNVK